LFTHPSGGRRADQPLDVHRVHGRSATAGSDLAVARRRTRYLRSVARPQALVPRRRRAVVVVVDELETEVAVGAVVGILLVAQRVGGATPERDRLEDFGAGGFESDVGRRLDLG